MKRKYSCPAMVSIISTNLTDACIQYCVICDDPSGNLGTASAKSVVLIISAVAVWLDCVFLAGRLRLRLSLLACDFSHQMRRTGESRTSKVGQDIKDLLGTRKIKDGGREHRLTAKFVAVRGSPALFYRRGRRENTLSFSVCVLSAFSAVNFHRESRRSKRQQSACFNNP